MTSEAPPRGPAEAMPSRPAARPLNRRQAHDHLFRLCEAVLWRMARRRMH